MHMLGHIEPTDLSTGIKSFTETDACGVIMMQHVDSGTC